jgi:MATE family multidrug resistance protein
MADPSGPLGLTFRARTFFALAVPLIVSRAGLATMDIADGLMVARYGAHEFAALALAEGTLGRTLDVCVALLIGGLVLVPRHLARGDAEGARLLWRRCLPVALGLGMACLLLALFGPRLLALASQPPALAAATGAVMTILGLGYPAALLAIASAVYLEGTRHPVFVAVSVLLANLINITLNWLLIAGRFGLPALGALGSAWSTTLVRFALALVLVGFAARSREAPGEDPTEEQLAERQLARRTQWRMGLGASATTAVMVTLATPLLLFAGRLGVLPLAIFSAIWNLAAPLGLVTLGLADAASIQIAAATGAHGDRAATSLAWAAVRTSLLPVAALLALWIAFARPTVALYTTDPTMRSAMPPLVPLMAGILMVDCAGFLLASSLRGLREVAWPTAIEIGSMLLLVPLAIALVFRAGYGVSGLLLAALGAGILRTLLLALRLRLRDRPAHPPKFLPESWPVHAE